MPELVSTDSLLIIGAGLPKTGTTSIIAACRALGLHSGGPHRYAAIDEHFRNTGAFDLRGTQIYPHFNSWHLPVMARRYPEAKYVYTTRPLEPWLESCARWFAEPQRPGTRRIELFGIRGFDRQVFTDTYNHHAAYVGSFFDAHPELDVLHFPIGSSWDRLCPFLGLPVPDRPFPHRRPRGSARADVRARR